MNGSPISDSQADGLSKKDKTDQYIKEMMERKLSDIMGKADELIFSNSKEATNEEKHIHPYLRKLDDFKIFIQKEVELIFKGLLGLNIFFGNVGETAINGFITRLREELLGKFDGTDGCYLFAVDKVMLEVFAIIRDLKIEVLSQATRANLDRVI